MGLQSALSTALTGMTAAETTIDIVGNNVANSQTVGFKQSDVSFATQFLQTQSLGSGPTGNTGGTNPRQIGLGTQVAQISPDFTQGTVEISSNPLDMAIQGDGFFIVQSAQGEELYTRNGQFSTNSKNELVTINGQRVLGIGVTDTFELDGTDLVPITIPLGSSAVAQATQNVFLEGSLSPTSELGDTPGIIQSAILSDNSYPVTTNLPTGAISTVTPPAFSSSVPGFAPATIPGSGLNTLETYSYRMTYVDDFGNETTASVESIDVTLQGSENQITLSGLPSTPPPTGIGAGVGTWSKNLYRSEGGGAYELLINLPATTDEHIDNNPTTGAALVTDTLTQGNYSYYITYENSSSTLETRPSALIGPQSVTIDGQGIRLDDIQDPADTAFYDKINIYRNTTSNPSNFYRVGSIASADTQDSFIDTMSNATAETKIDQINLEGPTINNSTLLTDVTARDGASYTQPFSTGTLSFTGRKGGRALEAKEFEITTTTTVQDLMIFMDQSMGIHNPDTQNNILTGSTLPGATVEDGRMQFTGNMGIENALEIGLTSFTLTQSGGLPQPISLPFSQTQAANGEGSTSDFVVYDSLGSPVSVRLTTVLESKTSSTTTYRWFADSAGNQGDPAFDGVDITVGTGTVTFDTNGNLDTTVVQSQTVFIERRDVASASLEFELDFSQVSGLSDESSTVNASRQDGSGKGKLTSFIVSETGNIIGVFSNGVSQNLGQMKLARFANNSGLSQVGENLYAVGVNSGLAITGIPGEEGIGAITAGAVELSNTDIGQNLIELILASTQYRGGARVITAVQELLDELMALQR